MAYKMKGFSGFGDSPVKQTKGEHAKWAKEFDAWTDKKLTHSKTRGNMPGPKIKKGGLPKDFNITGSDWPHKTPGYESTKMAKTQRYYKPKLSGLDMTLNDNLKKAVKGVGPGSPKTHAAEEFIKKNTKKTLKKSKLWRPFGPGTRPFAKNVTKVLKPLTRKLGVVGVALTAYDVFKKPINKGIDYVLNKKQKPRDMSKDVFKQGK